MKVNSNGSLECPHLRIQGDNYGETCLDCGAVIAGFGFYAEGHVPKCRHRYLPDGSGKYICPYCEDLITDEEYNSYKSQQ